MHPQPADVLSRPSRAPDLVVRYGPEHCHVADVRLASAGGAAPGHASGVPPLVILLHGGFWRAAYDRAHTGPLAEALADAGYAVCTPEYRRIGQAGGGWPGTLDDVAAAVRALPELVAAATSGGADPRRVVLTGHSAGGHLALWAARRVLTADRAASRFAVVTLAGVCNLSSSHAAGLGGGAVAELLGGGPQDVPDRYQAADPMALIPAGVPVWLVHGRSDDRVPWRQSSEYADRSRAAGGDVSCQLIEHCGHFELIDPLSAAWTTVLATINSAVAGIGRA